MQSVLSIIQAVEDALGQHATLRKLALQSRRLFARDLALIALSCRCVDNINCEAKQPRTCAWLVDTVAVQNPARVFTDLLVALREKHAIFHAVLHLLEPSSEQSFFVNTHWLARQPDHPTDVAFVLLPQDADPQYLSDPPPDVLAALRDLAAQSSDTPSTALALPLRTAIPFAGVLLGYPVAYVPAAPAPAFLAHTLLDVSRAPRCSLQRTPPASRPRASLQHWQRASSRACGSWAWHST
ncbi:hypothetical protein B0H10DRAFT_2222342 [Mycena sp. CBHHK59/15]|nr:hypothetical protein B0H10DRAFT_2222342 [Mycena sp. CBHHK59/15]